MGIQLQESWVQLESMAVSSLHPALKLKDLWAPSSSIKWKFIEDTSEDLLHNKHSRWFPDTQNSETTGYGNCCCSVAQ